MVYVQYFNLRAVVFLHKKTRINKYSGLYVNEIGNKN
ncbi:hypothetical protein SAMN05443543_104173 [Flavobacterium flevense]|nr:hypothetical protein SAMN05443543_104173 [Flavobacterium flevense]